TAQCLGGEETVLVGTVVTDKDRPAPLERRVHGERVERRALVGSPWARFRHGMAEQDLEIRRRDDLPHGGDAFLRSLGRLPPVDCHGGAFVFYDETRVRTKSFPQRRRISAGSYRVRRGNCLARGDAPLEAVQ